MLHPPSLNVENRRIGFHAKKLWAFAPYVFLCLHPQKLRLRLSMIFVIGLTTRREREEKRRDRARSVTQSATAVSSPYVSAETCRSTADQVKGWRQAAVLRSGTDRELPVQSASYIGCTPKCTSPCSIAKATACIHTGYAITAAAGRTHSSGSHCTYNTTYIIFVDSIKHRTFCTGLN